MQCITITTFSMILNEKTGDNFQPERGSREMYPFCVYSGWIRYRYPANQISLKISYLVFADDCLIFCKTIKKAARNIRYAKSLL